MPKLKVLTAKKLLRWLHKKGCESIRKKGSHLFLYWSKYDKTTIIPMHTGDLPRGTIRKILKDLDIDIKIYEKET